MTKEDMAKEIAHSCVDGARRAMIRGDADAFVSFFEVPHHIETLDGDIVLKDADGMKDQFEQVLAQHARLGVTRIERHLVDVSSKAPEEIECVYSTHLFAGKVSVRAPHSTFIFIRPIEGVWKISYTLYGASLADNSADVLVRRACNQPVLSLV